MRFGERLVDEGLVTLEQVEMALKAQEKYDGRIGTCLVDLGFLDTDNLARALARYHGVAPALCKHFRQVDGRVKKLIPAALADRYNVVPLGVTTGSPQRIVAAFLDPTPRILEEVTFALGRRVEAGAGPEHMMLYFLEKLYGIERRVRGRRVALGFPSALVDKILEGAARPAAPAPAPEPRKEPEAESPKARDLVHPAATPEGDALMPPPWFAHGLRSSQPDPWEVIPSRAGSALAAVTGAPMGRPADASDPATGSPMAGSPISAVPMAGSMASAPSAVVAPRGPAPSFVAADPFPSGVRADVVAPAAPAPAARAAAHGTIEPARPAAEPVRSNVATDPFPPPTISADPFPSAAPSDPFPVRAAAVPSADPFASPGGAVTGFDPFPTSRAFAPTPAPVAPAAAPVAEPVAAAVASAPAPAPATTSPVSGTERVASGVQPASQEPARGAVRPAVSAKDAAVLLERATGKDEVGLALVDYLRSAYAVGLVCLVRDDMILGWKGFAPDVDESVIEGLALPLTVPSMFKVASDSRAVFRGQPPSDGSTLHSRFYKLLRTSPPREVVVAPVVLGSRVVQLVYAHALGGGTLPVTGPSDLANLTGLAAQAYMRLLRPAR